MDNTTKPFPRIPRHTPGLDARYNNLVERYKQGVEEGTIDEGEQAYLVEKNNQYRRGLAKAKIDDGVIDTQERIQGHRFLTRASAEIYAFKHDQDQ